LRGSAETRSPDGIANIQNNVETVDEVAMAPASFFCDPDFRSFFRGDRLQLEEFKVHLRSKLLDSTAGDRPFAPTFFSNLFWYPIVAQKSGPPAIIFIVIFLILAAGGYWFFTRQQSSISGNVSSEAQAPNAPPPATPPSAPIPGSGNAPTGFSAPSSVPAGTVVDIDGSTSMVTINQNLKRGFEAKFPGTQVSTTANGSDRGLQALIAGNSDIAAISRPLTAEEAGRGLAAVAIASDRIAIVVGLNNPFTASLTPDQVRGIFQGEITDWSAVGGPPGTIRVINRPPVSGTHQAFKEIVLNGGNFGSTPNITTMERDATTPLLRELERNGVGYATYAQVANQQTVRSVPINGLTPQAENYPFQRILYYVYQNPPNDVVKAFLGYATSPEGQQAMLASD